MSTTRSDDNLVICPYCGNSYQAEGCDFDEREREETCFECRNTYVLYDECVITHHTRTKPDTMKECAG